MSDETDRTDETEKNAEPDEDRSLDASGDTETGTGADADSGEDSEQSTADGEEPEEENTPGSDAEGSGTGVQRLVDRVQNVPAEDWLLIALLSIVVVPAGYMYVDSQGWIGSDIPAGVDAEIVSACEEYSEAIETGAQLPAGTTCGCLYSGQFDEDRYQVAEYVENKTELFLVQCSRPGEDSLTIPIRYIPEEIEEDLTDDELEDLNATSAQ